MDKNVLKKDCLALVVKYTDIMTNVERIKNISTHAKNSTWIKNFLLWLSIWTALTLGLQWTQQEDQKNTKKQQTYSTMQGVKIKKLVEDATYELRKNIILNTDQIQFNKNFDQNKLPPYKRQQLDNEDATVHAIQKLQYQWQIDSYQEEWFKKLPPLSKEETESVEKMLDDYTIRCTILKDKPIMQNVNYIAVHSTGSTKSEVITYLRKTGKVHYVVLEDWSIIQYLASNKNALAQQNHLGKWWDPVSCASRNRNDQVTFETIGIEVMAGPAKWWSEKQYETLKNLLRYLSNKYNVKKGNVISHTMVAYNPAKGMMRKYDPFKLDREKLDLPPNDIQINKDILAGRIAPNLISMYKRLRKWSRGDDPGPWYSHEEAISYLEKHYAWVNYAILLHKDANGGQINSNAHLAKEPERWLTIDELNNFMKNYTPPFKSTKQIKHIKSTSNHKKHTKR